MEKPDCVTDEYLEYLDYLRDSGTTNMYSASPYLIDEFGLDKKEAIEILKYWMNSFGERHPG